MNRLAKILVTAILLTGMHSTFAADNNTQQSKMGMCNQQAGELKGDERKKFMSSCLKKDSAADTQQGKMKHCNEAASGKKGDERKAFMSQCLKKSDS